MTSGTERHDAVRWDGHRIEGGAPKWIIEAVQAGPLAPNSVIRVRDVVHVFDSTGKQLSGIAKPGDWILRSRDTKRLLVQTHEDMLLDWQYDRVGFVRRERRSKRVVAGTEMELQTGLQLQAGWLEIRPTQYPRLHEAMEDVSHDRGTGAGHEVYALPVVYGPALVAIERALGELSRDARQEFAIGDEKEQAKIAVRNPALRVCHDILNKFFEDWKEG